jgi:polysaccharide biosynthesis/export protein
VIITRPERDSSADPSVPAAISPDDAAPAPGQEATPPANAPSADSSAQKGPVFPSAVPAGPPAPAVQPSVSEGGASQNAPPPLTNTITINLNQILETGDLSNNIVLQPGDVVTVPHAGIIYVLGAVSRPGGYAVTNDRAQLTTLKVLSLAGGLNRTAKSDHAVIVRKDSTGQQHEVEVDLKKVMKFRAEDLQLRPSDILYVPNSAAKETLVKAGELALAIFPGVLVYRLLY